MSGSNRGKALFDSQVFASQRHGGVSRYFTALMRTLKQRGRWQPLLHAGVHFAHLGGADVAERVGISIRIPARWPRGITYAQALNRLISPSVPTTTDGPIVYHPTWYDSKLAEKYKDLPTVTTIHDLMPERWPGLASQAQMEARAHAIRTADRIICVSESTRKLLSMWYPGAEQKASTVHLGVPEYVLRYRAHQPPDAAIGQGTGQPYIVYVGKRGHYKDFNTLALALASVDADLKLVVAGGRPPDVGGPLGQLAAIGRATHIPNPSDRELATLIQGASALVSPSREEGFGLPPLEALALGIPVILSEIEVYVELYSDWAAFFDVGDVDGLSSLLAAAAERRLTRPTAAEIIERFSWLKTAAQTERVYAEAVASRAPRA